MALEDRLSTLIGNLGNRVRELPGTLEYARMGVRQDGGRLRDWLGGGGDLPGLGDYARESRRAAGQFGDGTSDWLAAGTQSLLGFERGADRIGSGFDNFFARKEQREAASKTLTRGQVVTSAADTTNEAMKPYWDIVQREAARIGVDPVRFAAILSFESNWNPNAVSSQGALGLGQVMPENFRPGENPYDPETNIMVAARVLAEKYAANGQDWDRATMGYLGWGVDANGTTPDVYLGKIKEQEGIIRQSLVPRRQAGGAATAGIAGLAGVTPNGTVTQEFGKTDFSAGQGAPVYDFGQQFGLDGDEHTGIDIGGNLGDPVYTPLGGTVIVAGGSGYYKDERLGDAPGRGELRIRLDNGAELILGHNSAITVGVGGRVEAGQRVANIGYANGPHVHVEMRVPDPSTPSGWRIVDPRAYLGGGAGGGGGTNR